MKLNKRTLLFLLVGGTIFFGILIWFGCKNVLSLGPLFEEKKKEAPAAPVAPGVITPHKPKYVRGIHLTSWIAGSPKMRAAINQMLDETELNTVVIDIKEYEGEVYIPGVKQADELKTYTPAVPDIKEYLTYLKSRGVYPIARIVVFKDNKFPRKKPSTAVKNPAGDVWSDRSGRAWIDPYSKAGWDYNIDIAERALDLGFEEIQFDYIRFPTDGALSTCRYSQVHSSTSSAGALVGFLKEANRRLKARGANISIDVFGLTTTVQHDMGIGQRIIEMTEQVDFVSPMVYPSHYAKGEYRIPDPNKAPYKTVFLGLEGAKRRLGEASPKLRPYLQDFSLGYHYGAKEVRDQIQASYDNDIAEWLLWNPRCVYTRAALKSKDFETAYNKNAVLPIQPAKTVKSGIETSSGTPAGHAPVAETSSFKKETGTGQETNQAGTAELKKILSPQTTTNNK